jgi:hypothetical protein
MNPIAKNPSSSTCATCPAERACLAALLEQQQSALMEKAFPLRQAQHWQTGSSQMMMTLLLLLLVQLAPHAPALDCFSAGCNKQTADDRLE